MAEASSSHPPPFDSPPLAQTHEDEGEDEDEEEDDDMLSLVQRIGSRLVSTSSFLTQDGRLELVNSVLSSLPTFFMSESASRPIVDFSVLNDNLIKYLISCVK
jgi:hypothetical protein